MVGVGIMGVGYYDDVVIGWGQYGIGGLWDYVWWIVEELQDEQCDDLQWEGLGVVEIGCQCCYDYGDGQEGLVFVGDDGMGIVVIV